MPSRLQRLVTGLQDPRWAVLLCNCFIVFGQTYIFDFPGNIGTGTGVTFQRRFRHDGQQYTETMNQVLYSVYGWPNVVLAFVWGVIMDSRLGLRNTTALGTFLMLMSAVIFLIGVQLTHYSTMVVGRVFLAIGGESLTVAQSVLVSRWFGGSSSTAFAFGIQNFFLRCFSAFTFYYSPIVAREAQSVVIAVVIGTSYCFVSLIAGVACRYLDAVGEDYGVVPKESRIVNQDISLRELLQMPPLVWLVSLLMFTLYGASNPFTFIAKDFFSVMYGVDGETGDRYVAYFQFITAGACPLFGFLVDRTGKFPLWLGASATLFAMFHGLYIFVVPPLGLAMTLLCVAGTLLLSSIWSAIPFVVKPNVAGVAYGLATSFLNLCGAVFPMITGPVIDAHTSKKNSTHSGGGDPDADDPLATAAGYRLTALIFFVTSCTSLVLVVIIWKVDKHSNHGRLSMSPAQRNETTRLMDTPAKGFNPHKATPNESAQSTPIVTPQPAGPFHGL